MKLMLTVNEIFYSIQGESTRAGPAVRVRASDGVRPPLFVVRHRRTRFTRAQELARRGHRGGRAVRLSARGDHGRRAAAAGGRLSADGAAVASGRTVMLETGGHRPIARVPRGVVKIVDVKCPGSGEAGRNDWTNLDALAPHDEVKFVIKDRADYEFARDVIGRYGLASRSAAVLLSPVHGVLEPRPLSEWMLADHLPARLQLQLHKYIWPPDDARRLIVGEFENLRIGALVNWRANLIRQVPISRPFAKCEPWFC